MQILLSAPHMDITPALDESVKKRLARLTTHVGRAGLQESAQAHVILDTGFDHAGTHQVRLELTGTGLDAPLQATARHADMYAAIEHVVDLVDRQWRKRKTARLSSRRHDILKSLAHA